MDDVARKSDKKIRNRKIIVGICKVLLIAVITTVILLASYFWLCFTDNGFVSKYRTLYVETALGTMTHQWLATSLLPYDVVAPVKEATTEQFEENIVDTSEVARPVEETAFSKVVVHINKYLETDEAEIAKQLFMREYSEIDMSTLPQNIDYSNIQISDIVDMGIKTIHGDPVWAIDTVNGIVIIQVSGEGYCGKLAIVKDSSQVRLATSSASGAGQTVTKICANNDAILGINSSGFYDAEGKGNGGQVVGLVISGGKMLNPVNTGRYQIAGYDEYNNFYVGKNLDTSKLRDAMQFYPIIVLNGENKATGSYGMGIQPRTVIGQTMNKETLMLIVDGRQIGYSIGTTMDECAKIMIRYGAWNAMNMDGGSSSSMTYNGEMITRTSSPAKQGRQVPCAWIVEKRAND